MVEKNNQVLAIILHLRCNLKCQHCLCAGADYPDISDVDVQRVIAILKNTGIRRIQITGGEPTIDGHLIRKTFDRLNMALSDLSFEIVTNGYFASSLKKCRSIFDGLYNLKKVYISYDAFHARFVSVAKINTLVKYCHQRGVDINGFATIATPLDIVAISEYEKKFGIKFYYQKVMPIGNAYKNNTGYFYANLEKDVLRKKCPQISSLVYVPSYGVTHCCSSLLYKCSKAGRSKIINYDVEGHLESDFYKLMSNFNMKKLMKKAGIDVKLLTPSCSSICELCQTIMPNLLGNDNAQR